jgi:hypothetical protein
MEYLAHSVWGEIQAIGDYERIDPPSLILINFDVPALTAGLHWAETALEFSNNEALFGFCRI